MDKRKKKGKEGREDCDDTRSTFDRCNRDKSFKERQMLSRGGVECGLSSYRLTKIPITVIQGCSEMARVEIAKWEDKGERPWIARIT